MCVTSKTPGCDKVNAKILKDSSPVIAPIITSLINSFTLSTFPLPWKKAEIVLILKSGDTEEPANTRPISLLPILSKVFERAAHLQLTNFLHSNNVIHHRQSGNRKLHSTEAALLHFTDELRNNMDQKKISVIVLLDISKAFDSIRQDLIIRKVRRAGVSESSCSQFEAVYRNVKSLNFWSLNPYGWSTAKIMGPVLFTLYVNDFFRVRKHCEPLGYVDDTTIFHAFPTSELNDVISAVNEDLKEISIWCCRNSLLISLDKTKLPGRRTTHEDIFYSPYQVRKCWKLKSSL